MCESIKLKVTDNQIVQVIQIYVAKQIAGSGL